jgi:hypothetical protein
MFNADGIETRTLTAGLLTPRSEPAGAERATCRPPEREQLSATRKRGESRGKRARGRAYLGRSSGCHGRSREKDAGFCLIW